MCLSLRFSCFIFEGKLLEPLPVVPHKAVAEVSKIENL